MSFDIGSGASGAGSGAQIGTMIMPGIGTAIGGVIGAVAGGLIGGKANRAKKKAEALRKRMANLSRHYNRRAAIASFQAEQAGVLMQTTAQGVGTRSSGYQGIQASLSTQINQNLKTSADMWKYGNQVARWEKQATRLQNSLTTAQGVADAMGSMSKMIPKSPGKFNAQTATYNTAPSQQVSGVYKTW